MEIKCPGCKHVVAVIKLGRSSSVPDILIPCGHCNQEVHVTLSPGREPLTTSKDKLRKRQPISSLADNPQLHKH